MIQHSDLSIPVYEQIKKMIFNKELKPGEKLLQEKLAARLGVSRTPLLKALQMLEYDFLVESVPRKGMFVKIHSITEMQDIYDVREGIETVAIRLTTERITENQFKQLKNLWRPFENLETIEMERYRLADDKFHDLILKFSGNKILQKIYSHSNVKLMVEQMGLMRSPKDTLPEHLDMLKAMEEGDAESAMRIMKNHIQRSKALIENNF